MGAPRWLDERERRAWLDFLVMHAQLTAELHRQLRADAGLSLADFDVLAQLTEHPEGTVRSLQLGRSLQWEKSRLSHHLSRMEARGLIRRESCPHDQRGALVVVTDLGRRAVEQAAPAHVEAVRALFFDELSPDEVTALGNIAGKVLTRLRGGREP